MTVFLIFLTCTLSILHTGVGDVYSMVSVSCDDQWMLQKGFAESLIHCVLICDINLRCLGLMFVTKRFECQLFEIHSDYCSVQPSLTVPFYRRNGRRMCQGEWIQYGSSCYTFIERKMPYNEAKANCESKGAYLVEIQSEEEDVFLAKFIDSLGKRCIMVGGTDEKQEGNWIWPVSNRSLVYTNWDFSEPNNYGRGEDCICIFHNKKWYDISCSKDYHSMCEVDMTTL